MVNSTVGAVRDRKRSGFSLVELMVAVVILSVGVLSMAGTSVWAVRQITLSWLTTERSVARQSAIETILAGPYANAIGGSGTFGSYVHHDGKRAVLLQIDGEADAATLKGICQHIVAMDPQGISETQCHFIEIFMAFCLLHDSPAISQQERSEIDYNLDAVAYRGREPGLLLQHNGGTTSLQQWAGELCAAMEEFATTLDQGEEGSPYRQALQQQQAAVADPEKTLSAQVLAGMREHNEGYFHYAQRMSKQHQQYFLDLKHDAAQLESFKQCVRESLAQQRSMEAADSGSFDEFLKNYFAQTL